MATRSQQLAVPLSQNTAPVFKFNCLYTHDIVRKQKRWQDGVLCFHTFNKRVMVYDLSSNFIGDTHWRDSDTIGDGDELKLDRGVIVQVGEETGRKQQDISEIFATRKTVRPQPNTTPVIQNRSTRLSHLSSANLSSGIKPKSLNAVLGTGRRPIGRANFPGTSSQSNWASPSDGYVSPPPAKRTKLDTTQISREVLAPKLQQQQAFKATPVQAQIKAQHTSRPAFTAFDKVPLSPGRDSTCAKPLSRMRRKETESRLEESSCSPPVRLNKSKQRPQTSERVNQLTELQRAESEISEPQPVPAVESNDRPRQILKAARSRRKKLILYDATTKEPPTSHTAKTSTKRREMIEIRNSPEPQTKIPNPQSLILNDEPILISSSIEEPELGVLDYIENTPPLEPASLIRTTSASICGKDGLSSVGQQSNITPSLNSRKPPTLPTKESQPTKLQLPNNLHAEKSTLQKAPSLVQPAASTSIPIPPAKNPKLTPLTTPASNISTAKAAPRTRSPLKKSLTATETEPKKTSPRQLSRSKSDQMVPALLQRKEEELADTGPWSREAFDLFGWKKGDPKGKNVQSVVG
jgi:hypothetical protein